MQPTIIIIVKYDDMLGNASMFAGIPTPCIYSSQVFICTNMMLIFDIFSWKVLIQSIFLVEEIITVIFYVQQKNLQFLKSCQDLADNKQNGNSLTYLKE